MYKLQKRNINCFDSSIEVYLLTFDLTMDITSLQSRILSEDEVKRSEKYRFHADKVRFVITRSVLRQILAKQLNITNSKFVDFNYDSYGKPSLAHFYKPYFNVSHSGHNAIIAICNDYRVGVDIESRDTFSPSVVEIVANFFSEQERLQGKDSIDDIYTKWVLKESLIKAIGYGLSLDMKSFSVFNKASNNQSYEVYGMPKSWGEFKINCIQDEAYIAAMSIMKESES